MKYPIKKVLGGTMISGWQNVSRFFHNSGFAIVFFNGEAGVLTRIFHEEFYEGTGWFVHALINNKHEIFLEDEVSIRLAKVGEDCNKLYLK